MACADRREALELWLDGEAPPAEAAALEAHLAVCAPCALEALRGRELRAAIREAGRAFEPPAALRGRLRLSATRPASRWLLPLAAALLLSVGGAVLVQRLSSAGAVRQLALAELVDLHVGAVGSASPVDVVSSERHTVKPWFTGKVPFAFDLPELDGTPFALLGGRVAWVGGEPAAQLLFSAGRHRISAFLLRSDVPAAERLGNGGGSARSFRTRSWEAGGVRWVLVSDASTDALDGLAALLWPR